MIIDISSLNKAEVLQALFNASKQQGMGFLDGRGHYKLSLEDSQVCIDRGGSQYYDYLRGRVLKIDLSKDELDTRLYDRDNGHGAAERALQPLFERFNESQEPLGLGDSWEGGFAPNH